MKIKRKILSFVLIFALLGSLLPSSMAVQAKNSQKTVTMGKSISVYKKGATYCSSDSSVAYVDKNGRVTGKKVGTATITVKKSGSSNSIDVSVKKSAKKKYITVCADEIQIKTNKVTWEENTDEVPPEESGPESQVTEDNGQIENQDVNAETGEEATLNTETDSDAELSPEEPNNSTEASNRKYCVTVTVKNVAKKSASKVILYAKLGEETLKFSFGKIGSGKTKSVTVTGEFNEEATENTVTYDAVELLKIQVTSNKMIHTYNYLTEAMSLAYGTKDTTKPVFSGFIEKNSYNEGIPYQIVYSDKADDYDFTKYVKVEDDRDTKVKIKVDTSNVNFKKTGTYKVIYKATDSAGNTAKTYAKIGIRVATDLDSYCDTVLSKIIKSSWSDTKKARAIYNYTRGHISYTGVSDKSSWEREAVNGIRYGRGDCFTYYSVARALLTRAGIPNIKVTRVKGEGHHWWNMVYVQGAFYHYDACPRREGGRFCLVTDAQLKKYSSRYGNSHIWAYDKKPKSGTKILSSIF